MSAAAPASEWLRIGDVARLVGTTARTIRYYEEIGLLGEPAARPAGRHRLYSQAEVDYLREVIRLRSLLNVSLEELKTLVEAEEARKALRAEVEAGVDDPRRLRALLAEARGHLERQLELVRRRGRELRALEADLEERQARVERRLAEL
ncbi:MAG TPA: MerR family transcriptional regulator [Solirubrobacteraceae bacterium]|nr:MerR family transcriptional regulator [Solirubrobacteraceae bacterium]